MNPVFPHDDGMFIVIEGPTCSGKSTLVAALASHMRGTGKFAPLVKSFPTRGPVGQLIRGVRSGNLWSLLAQPETISTDVESTKQQKFDRAMSWLHTADQISEEEDTFKAIREKRTVIYDRHHLVSSWAYWSEHLSMDSIIGVGQAAAFRRPDIVFIMDLPPDQLLERMKARAESGEKEAIPYYEKTDMEMVYNRYLSYALMHRENTVSLDGSASVDSNIEKIMETIEMFQGMYASFLAKTKE